MKTMKAALLLLAVLLTPLSALGQKGLLHIDLQGGYAYFPRMSRPSGWNFNIGSRWGITDRYFAALQLNGGINHGHTRQMYAGEMTRTDHDKNTYMLGAGPGIYLYNSTACQVYTHLALGYGWGEENGKPDTAHPDEISRRTFCGVAMMWQAGVEREVGGWHILGLGCGLSYIWGERPLPTIYLKYGLYFDL